MYLPYISLTLVPVAYLYIHVYRFNALYSQTQHYMFSAETKSELKKKVALYQYSFKDLLLKLEYFKYLTRCTKRKIQGGAIKQLLNGMCICMSDNPLAKACGLSSCTCAQTINVHQSCLQLMKNFVIFFFNPFYTNGSFLLV